MTEKHYNIDGRECKWIEEVQFPQGSLFMVYDWNADLNEDGFIPFNDINSAVKYCEDNNYYCELAERIENE